MPQKKLKKGSGALAPAFCSLLDSSLISGAKPIYNVKVVQCGNYVQLYFLENKKKVPKDKEQDFSDLNLRKNDEVVKGSSLLEEIELKNIIRSKLACQRLAKANMEYWKSFITLTFSDNISDLEYCNKKFHHFAKSVKRVFKDFKYICVPEFQKRGAVHYHLLTNIEVDSILIPKRETKKLYNKEMKTWKYLQYYDIRYWNYGFSSAEEINGDVKKIIGYISKYMTKDIDNRLFGKHRYFYSQNLNKISSVYLDLDNLKDFNLLNKILSEKECIFQDFYKNYYNNDIIHFLEYL